MKSNALKLAAAAAMLFLLSVNAASADDEDPSPICEQTDTVVTCGLYGERCWSMFYSNLTPPSIPKAGLCKRATSTISGTEEHLQENTLPTNSPEIVCEVVDTCQLSCTASPFGDGVSYAWSRSGSAFFAYPPGSSNQALINLNNASAGMVTVTVNSPYHKQAQASWGIIANSLCSNF